MAHQLAQCARHCCGCCRVSQPSDHCPARQVTCLALAVQSYLVPSWHMIKIQFMSWWNKVWILRASFSHNCGWCCYPSKCLVLRKGERTGYCEFYCEFLYPFQVLCCNFLHSLNSKMSPVSLHRELWKFGTAKPWKVYLLIMKYSF